MKYLPAYAKKIIELRKLGRVPANRVIISFDWKIGRIYPRIVITNKYPIQDFEFSFLAGLPVEISYEEKDAYRITELAHEVLKANPVWLATFALHLVGSGNPAFTILHDEITKNIQVVA